MCSDMMIQNRLIPQWKILQYQHGHQRACSHRARSRVNFCRIANHRWITNSKEEEIHNKKCTRNYHATLNHTVKQTYIIIINNNCASCTSVSTRNSTSVFVCVTPHLHTTTKKSSSLVCYYWYLFSDHTATTYNPISNQFFFARSQFWSCYFALFLCLNSGPKFIGRLIDVALFRQSESLFAENTDKFTIYYLMMIIISEHFCTYTP